MVFAQNLEFIKQKNLLVLILLCLDCIDANRSNQLLIGTRRTTSVDLCWIQRGANTPQLLATIQGPILGCIDADSLTLALAQASLCLLCAIPVFFFLVQSSAVLCCGVTTFHAVCFLLSFR